MLIPFRDQRGRLDLVALGMDGSQAIYQATETGQYGRFVFIRLSPMAGGTGKEQTTSS